jgi:S-adenosylmethionine:tRNA ribosyltransferase-isomerase
VLAQIRTSKRLQTGSVIQLKDRHVAKIITRSNGMYELEFSSPVKIFIDNFGELPIPPYLKRSAEALDSDRYQTIYAKKLGAVAAPTAGLHFDQEMFEQTRILNVDHAYITLHVGAGTYQPLKREHIEENKLHSEFIEVSKETCSAIANAQDKGGRVIAVGTTTVRAIEAVSQNNEVSPWSGETDIFIKPDYRFKTVNALLTNFHLPKSSLLLLVSAMAGKEMIMKAYEYAIEKKFRFYSYGDAMLIFPKGLS